MIEENYFLKYMIYKKKYLELKSNSIGGSNFENCQKILSNLEEEYFRFVKSIEDSGETRASLRQFENRVKEDLKNVKNRCGTDTFNRMMRKFKKNIISVKNQNIAFYDFIMDTVEEILEN